MAFMALSWLAFDLDCKSFIVSVASFVSMVLYGPERGKIISFAAAVPIIEKMLVDMAHASKTDLISDLILFNRLAAQQP